MRQTGVTGTLPIAAPSTAEQVNLGDIEPVQGPMESSATGKQVLANINATRSHCIGVANSIQAPEKASVYRRRYVALSLQGYLDAIKYERRILGDFERTSKKNNAEDRHSFRVDEAEIYQFLVHIYKKDMHTPDFQGYLNYVCAVSDFYEDCINKVTLPTLNERAREQHTYITGGSGSGKTELMNPDTFQPATALEHRGVKAEPDLLAAVASADGRRWLLAFEVETGGRAHRLSNFHAHLGERMEALKARVYEHGTGWPRDGDHKAARLAFVFETPAMLAGAMKRVQATEGEEWGRVFFGAMPTDPDSFNRGWLDAAGTGGPLLAIGSP